MRPQHFTNEIEALAEWLRPIVVTREHAIGLRQYHRASKSSDTLDDFRMKLCTALGFLAGAKEIKGYVIFDNDVVSITRNEDP